MGEKHFVYSARTTEQGLALLKKARGERGWDAFVNEALCTHYSLDHDVINPPPSRALAEREERRKSREAEKPKGANVKKSKAENRPRKPPGRRPGSRQPDNGGGEVEKRGNNSHVGTRTARSRSQNC